VDLGSNAMCEHGGELSLALSQRGLEVFKQTTCHAYAQAFLCLHLDDDLSHLYPRRHSIL